jgi:hypothetical protein
MNEGLFFTMIWLATMTALPTIMVYRIAFGDWAGSREISLAASAWYSLSIVELMALRWSGMKLFEE